MRDSLVELIYQALDNKKYVTGECVECSGLCFGCESFIYLLADYLLSNGVILPPVNPGSKVYRIVDMRKHFALKSFISFSEVIEPYQMIYKNILGGYSVIPFDEFGKTVFLNRDEAEIALLDFNK